MRGTDVADRQRGGTSIWVVVIGLLFVLVGLWALFNGLACAAVTNSLTNGMLNGASQFCTTYEVGGALLLVLGIVLALGSVLAPRYRRH